MEVQRESIFVSAIRTFCKFFFGVVAIFLAFILSSTIYSSFAPSNLLETHTNLEILPNAEGVRELAPPTAPVILQISITGVIGDPNHINTESIQNILLDSRSGMLGKDRVKGILLYVNTPGGTVVDADNIYRMLKEYKARYKVPIYTFVDGLCASGGMYVASSSDQIFAGPSSITGSVGVVLGPFFNISQALGKVGIEARTLTKGIDKDMMNPTRPWKEGEDESLKAVMSYFYQRFVHVVTEARPKLDRTQLIETYGAQVYDCETAKNYGYVDHANTSRNDALKGLLAAAQIDETKSYQVIELSPKTDWIKELMQGKSPLLTGKMEHSFDIGQLPIQEKVAYLYQP